ncbi:hypothetical protein [Sulfobacillus thermosulfidooxidans]|uniref:hypothetical protein n=1 Tax=Sulfobacillus thermosulfidooxidans TaxID=28034 RepID=UPI0006B4F7F8|nr:hypothetical protein [Sulfobacillus thermosulfidooxidans]
MESWHEIAWQKWQDDMTSGLPENVRHALEEMDGSSRAKWIARLRHNITPCAKIMAQYLKTGDKPWVIAPGLQWDIVETAHMVFIAYPEYLGEDPLAMAAIGLLWASSDVTRIEAIVKKLGPTALYACYEGQLPSSLHTLFGVLWQNYIQNFGLDEIRSEVRQFFSQVTVTETPFVTISLGSMPAYAMYLEELTYGVVPHETSGESPKDVPAVLTALHYVPAAERPGAALLAFKAIEGRILTDQWQRAALMEKRDGVDRW